MKKNNIPNDWCNLAHKLWLADDKNACINQAIETMNSYGITKPKAIYEQLAYYLYLVDDFKSAAFFIEQGLIHYPDEHQMMMNLAVIYSELNEHQKSIDISKKLIKSNNDSVVIYDPICSSSYQLGDYQSAAYYGTQSLIKKDNKYCAAKTSLSLNLSISAQEVASKKKVIAYSLWGNNPRYINGALRNLILAKDIYPQWEVWIYLDDSVDEKHINAFKALGGVIIEQPPMQSIKQKLCWRFFVASDQRVGHFIVRDADSVINVREYQAVQDWLMSDRPFHILRDWWTHTDLILAGMWGGIANVLPDIKQLLENFSSGKMETPHIDQWFLGQIIWPNIKERSLIHDRFFNHPLSVAMPGIDPGSNWHIGSCEHTQDANKQEQYLAPWKAHLYS